MKYYIGIDLGGTNIVAGIVDGEYNLLNKASRKTDLASAEAVVTGMVEAARQAVADANLTMSDIEWVGVGTPGLVNAKTGTVEFSANLPLLKTPLGDMITAQLGVPAYVENDANAAAYGETLAGAAKGAKDAVALTLGTGVGGGILIDGKIYRGFNFAGAEMGHMVVQKDGRQCGCGRKGCIEAYASASGLIQSTREAMEAHKDSKLWEIAGSLDAVDGKTAFDAMRAGDAVGAQVVQDFVEYLGCAVANVINIFQPEVICIGGGICKEGETLLRPLREYLATQDYCANDLPKTKVVTATLGNDAGIIGAAFLGRQA